MPIRINFSILMFLGCLATRSIHCNLLDSQKERLDGVLLEIEENSNQAKSNFWKFQKMAEGDHQTHRAKFIDLIQHGIIIEMTKYAILRKSILAGELFLSKRFSFDDSGNLVDEKQKLTKLEIQIPAIVTRLLVRAYADSERYTGLFMSRLHSIIELFVEEKKDPSMIEAAVAIYRLVDKFMDSLKKHLVEYQVASQVSQNDIGANKTPVDVAVLDETIDELMNCVTCSSETPDKDLYDTKTMFASPAVVFEALREMMDESLTDALSDHIDAGKIEFVSRENVLSLMKKILDEYDGK